MKYFGFVAEEIDFFDLRWVWTTTKQMHIDHNVTESWSGHL